MYFCLARKVAQELKTKIKRKFADIDHGLLRIKINHLIKCKLIDKIYLSTNDEKIIKFVKKLTSHKIIIHRKVIRLYPTSKTTTQKLINHASDLIPDGHILWTHVTSPFVNNNIYEKIVEI